ncbi:MAG TPA: WYL domain-containing protein [Acidimicrobiales bacterium]|nr:WYL domain-containing protein [Acidimicrobiales bacterium]
MTFPPFPSPACAYHPAIPNGSADARFERVTNLVTFLLHTRLPASLVDVVEQVPGYPPGEHARRQAFERDKRVLRQEGVPLTEEGGRYRIRPQDYYLPELDLSPDERVALNVAVAAVSISPEHGLSAIRKLGGAEVGEHPSSSGSAVRADARLVDLPVLPALPVLHAAIRDRAVVRFSYRSGSRRVEPYGLLFRDGHWYLAGGDLGRDALRNFRVDRIEGTVEIETPGTFQPPASFNLQEALARQPWLLGGEDVVTASVVVDGVLAGKVGSELGEEAVREHRPDGSTVFAFPVTNRSAFRSWLLGLAHHAEVLEPAELRDEVVGWLESLAAGQAQAGSG